MAINKVTHNGNILLDLTTDTVTNADVLSGVSFHLPNGQAGTGEFVRKTPKTATTTVASGSTPLSFSVEREPTSFIILPEYNVSITSGTNTWRFVMYYYDGTNSYLVRTVRVSTSSVEIKRIDFAWSYSNGTLEISYGVANGNYRIIYV